MIKKLSNQLSTLPIPPLTHPHPHLTIFILSILIPSSILALIGWPICLCLSILPFFGFLTIPALILLSIVSLFSLSLLFRPDTIILPIDWLMIDYLSTLIFLSSSFSSVSPQFLTYSSLKMILQKDLLYSFYLSHLSEHGEWFERVSLDFSNSPSALPKNKLCHLSFIQINPSIHHLILKINQSLSQIKSTKQWATTSHPFST